MDKQANSHDSRHDEFAVALFRWLQHVKEPLRSRLLPKRYFLAHLRRDKLRADRLRSRLSVIVIRLDKENTTYDKRFGRFLAKLHDSLRETDSLGYLGDGIIGLILPDTDGEKTTIVLDRIVAHGEDYIVSATQHTYPDELFESLNEEFEDRPKESPLVFHELDKAYCVNPVLKRGLDILCAGTGLVLLFPVFVTTAIAIKLTSPGSVIFRQARLGRHAIPFMMYKFRSMYSGVDDRTHREYVEKLIKGRLGEKDQVDSGKRVYKMASDSRITPVGKFIRKWSIDELPQLFNVLKGDMSLVGPRPPLLYEAEKYESWHLRRLFEAKPGMTGLWQVEGRSETTFDEMVRLDLRYSRDCSIFLDLAILKKTIAVVLRRRGAV